MSRFFLRKQTILCAVFGSFAGNWRGALDQNNFIQFLSELQTTRHIFLLLAGLVAGGGDFIGLSAYQFVPAVLGFPVQIGVGVTVGTLSSYFIVGCDQFWYLFAGLAMCVSAVLVLALGQALPRQPCISESMKPTPASAIAPNDMITESSISLPDSLIPLPLPEATCINVPANVVDTLNTIIVHVGLSDEVDVTELKFSIGIYTSECTHC